MKIYKHYIKPYLSHPLNKDHKIKSIFNFLKWQWLLRISNWRKAWLIVTHECGFRIVVKKGQSGMTGNLYSGLMEFEEMMFVIHYLRRGDIFFDIGSNAGIYTLLASALKGAKAHSFEPVPATYYFLKMNVAANNLEGKVSIYNKAVGDKNGKVIFAADLDAMNKVLTDDYSGQTVEAEVIGLDAHFLNTIDAPAMLKIDTEGYELNVLQGALQLLENNQVKAVLVEMNQPKAIHELLFQKGFLSYSYDPYHREIIKADHLKKANIIYVRDIDFVQQRLKTAEAFTIRGQRF